MRPTSAIARALGAEVALGGEAGVERALGLDHGARGAQRERLVQHLIVPQGLVVGVEEEVRVALDHARASGSRREGRSTCAPAGAARFGPAAAMRSPSTSTDQPSWGLRIHPVEHARGTEEDRLGERRDGEEQSEQEQDQAAHRLPFRRGT